MNSIEFLSETCGLVQVPMFRASTLCRDWGKGKVDILHCDAQGAEVGVLQDCEDLLRAGSIRFLVLSTHAEAISGSALTHQLCLDMIRRFGGQILAEHDVHESFSGDGLIAAHFGSPLLDWPDLKLSRNRYSTSLFRNPLHDVAELREICDNLSTGLTSTSTASVPASRVKHIYNTLLERDPEPGIGEVRIDPVDYCLSVALSPEREALLQRKDALGNLPATGLVISSSPYGGNWVTDMSDTVIGHSLRTRGDFEEEEISQVTAFLNRLDRWQPGRVFLDIGSNIGTHTIFALYNGFSSAICIEPDEKNFRLLQVNQLLNRVDERCRNFKIGASNFEGTVQFELSPDNLGDHRIRAPGPSSISLGWCPQAWCSWR